ncbi:hypothetical protein [Mucilaginibacter gotjawali]|uniref:Uncharacterized protein n=1 Tax=Mucilaginibacter gotjawali TaxID=1550579 RepID=A0A839SGX9_9SPHI|nr:hypothetical protein [Mucilaginibacter gotjawali]MBB3057535.1 hypothetical protein [Mucilaginibacter gotjawali]
MIAKVKYWQIYQAADEHCASPLPGTQMQQQPMLQVGTGLSD